MKRFIIVLLILFTVVTFSITAYAAETTQEIPYLEESGIREAAALLDAQTKDYLKDLGLDELGANSLSALNFSNVISVLFKGIKPELKTIAGRFLSLFGVLLLSTFSINVNDAEGKPGTQNIFRISTALFIILLTIQPMSELLLALEANLSVGVGFLLAVVPILCIILSAQGRTLTAGIYSGSVLTLSEIISFLFSYFFLPGISILLGFTLCGGFERTFKIQKLTALVKKLLLIVLSALSTLYFSVLSIRSGLSSAADSIGVKTVKFAAGNFVPVIGSAISESAGVVISALSLTKSAVGGFGTIALLLLFAPLVFKMLLWMVGFEISSYVAHVFDNETAGDLLKGLADILSVMMIIALFDLLVLLISMGMVVSVKGNV